MKLRAVYCFNTPIVSHGAKQFHIVKGVAMSAQMQSSPETLPAFCEGIQYFADGFPEIDRLGAAPLLGPGQPALPDATSEAAIYQTLLAADALRYLTLQVTCSKSSGDRKSTRLNSSHQ